jgi:hypothetical protein
MLSNFSVKLQNYTSYKPDYYENSIKIVWEMCRVCQSPILKFKKKHFVFSGWLFDSDKKNFIESIKTTVRARVREFWIRRAITETDTLATPLHYWHDQATITDNDRHSSETECIKKYGWIWHISHSPSFRAHYNILRSAFLITGTIQAAISCYTF